MNRKYFATLKARTRRTKFFNVRAVVSYLEIFVVFISLFAFSYFVYYSSANSVTPDKNPLDSIFSGAMSGLTKPVFGLASAASTLSTPSVCCEKTTNGASCINTQASSCAAGSKTSPTSCESTSYCKLGTCYDSQEGICMENTPQVVCNAKNGTWSALPSAQLPQCQLGCCILADQAAFVPLVRCKKLSSSFGVTMNYNPQITSETDCIATAQAQDVGACVYQQDFANTCKFTTRGDCSAPEVVIAVNSTNTNTTSSVSKAFYKNYLCSAEELNTNCARQVSTECYQGKVYWVDSCGNRENIYFSNKDLSWNSGKVLADDSVCAANDGSNVNCGNCDYLLGSRCSAWDGNVLNLGKPSFGSNYCKKTVCKDAAGNERKNGESWCVDDSTSGNGTASVGSRGFRDVCVDGVVHVEPCTDYRQQVCVQGSISTSAGQFLTAGCRVNRWQDCNAQKKQTDCEDQDIRDCTWMNSVPGFTIGSNVSTPVSGQAFTNPTATSQAFTNPTASSTLTNPTASSTVTGKVIASTDSANLNSNSSTITGDAVASANGSTSSSSSGSNSSGGITVVNNKKGLCVPSVPPGLQFWQTGDAQSICAQASGVCNVTFEKRLIGTKQCVGNCQCLTAAWAQQANQICSALGDCGGKVNYVGQYTDDGYEWKVNGVQQKFGGSGNSVGTGKVVQTNLIGNAILTVYAVLGFAPKSNNVVTSTPITGNAIWGVVGGKVVDFNDQMPANYVGKIYGSQAEAQSAITSAGTGGGSSALVPAGSGVPNLAPGVASPGAGWITQGGNAVGSTGAAAPSAGGALSTASGAISAGPQTLTQVATADKLYTWTSPDGKTSFFTKTFATDGKSTYAVGPDGKPYLINSQADVPAGLQFTNSAELAATQQTYLAQWMGLQIGSAQSALVGAVEWAGIAFGAGYLIGTLFGMSKGNTMALATSMAAGFGIYQGLVGYTPWIHAVGLNGAFGALGPQIWAGAIGIGVGVAIFLYMYKTDSTQLVRFTCMPWQAPRGGSDCDKCNSDSLKPCSEYRCKALGQSCDIVNAGTDQEKCVNINPKDVEPPVITPDSSVLTSGYKYTPLNSQNPPGAGFQIVPVSGGQCIKAFTPITFGVDTDEPAQCKIDLNHTLKMSDMQFWFGETNLYLENHTELLTLPGTKDLQNSSIMLENGNTMNFFVRCSDSNGNENPAEYNVRLCIDPSPDTTPPEIKATSIASGSCVAENQNSANVDFYVSEPAECRWSKQDQAFENMNNTMNCANQVYQINALQLYTCTANLNGIARDNTTFYVRCKDQPNSNVADADRNVNKQSYVFSLRGSSGLKIENLLPNMTVYGSINPAPTTLAVDTLFGCDNGQAICFYKPHSASDSSYVQFFTTGDVHHEQEQDLSSGSYTYDYKCVDSGGNVAINSTTFNMEIDTNAPVVARAYQEDNMLKIVTVRNSDCVYSFDNCDFSFAEGTNMPYSNSTNHVADWKQDQTYYIKCRDQYRPETADCSIIVRPSKNFL